MATAVREIVLASSSGRVRTVVPGPERIEDIDEVRDYIFGLDFGLIKWNLMNPAVGSQLPISQDKADFSETLYKRWLFLRRKHEGKSMPPSTDIDEFWHAHILDTYAYTEHCDRIFGYYFHHYPYFGTRGKADEQALYQAWDNTIQLYQDEFGEPLYQYD